jgi:tRNA-dihydrouridine synthase
MLSAKRLPMENATLSPYLVRTDREKPLSYQLLVTGAADVEPAVAALHRLGADAVDLNLGCPAPKVKKKGGGIALMSRPETVREIIRSARRATELPLSAKIRLGETADIGPVRDFCLLLQDEGVDLITVHARLKGESFARKPRWALLAGIKKELAIPMVANGGIFSVADARKCLDQSGADGLMIGRAAARTPWLFAEIAREIYGIAVVEKKINRVWAYGEFVRGLLRFVPERRLGRLKEFSHYFALNYSFGHHLAMAVQRSQSMLEAWDAAVTFFQRADGKALAETDHATIRELLAAGFSAGRD